MKAVIKQEGDELLADCEAKRCFYRDAFQCQDDQGWHCIDNGFMRPCDCPCHAARVAADRVAEKLRQV